MFLPQALKTAEEDSFMKQFSKLMVLSTLLLSACADSQFEPADLVEQNQPEIIGGKTISNKDTASNYVAKITLLKSRNDLNEYLCTASHISKTVLVTAAHCFTGKDIRYSEVVYNSGSWFSSETRNIKKIKIYPGYPGDIYSDIALVKIEKAKPESQKILRLNFNPTDKTTFPIVAIGYGITDVVKAKDEEGTGYGVLRSTSVNVLNYDHRNKFFDIDMSQGHGINGGDSGGPALYFQNDVPSIIGVARDISYTKKKNGDMIFKGIGTYTSVAYFQSWLEREVKDLEEQ